MQAQETAAAAGLARPTIGMALARLLLFLVPIFVLLVVGEFLLETQLREASARTLALQGLLCGVWIAVYRIGVRLLERRSASELGFDASLSLVPAGILIGTALFCSVYAILCAAGIASLVGWHGLDGVAAILGVAMTAAVGEEIVFRGVVYRILENTFGTLAALIVSSLLFGLMHSTNPGATLFTSTAVALEAGLLLGLAYSATRSLWFPIGIHFGWNFAQGGIFSAPVSGFQFKGILDFRLSGPEILTGGSFGPESSIVALLVCLFGSLWMVWAVIRFGRWCPLKMTSRAPRP
jgi:membrane protease YdiL (CAAX protease family)